ncbi:hypothetical protein BKA82DRAFT_163419 [Pisolithus tinctorius]|uniref:Uncharacterized protein n=1 Tax=Pisolithus tinctorius Marx 270 TaxID=870435 RepID=A0A0C3NLZ4_PISTI|nr:hypothetical protein BKA82DRAFT_163419 [Pisolithus tinctorius]KIN96313.1 hypothetical protein M404DRAFT_163419 [Pisolithus tinctorius Marx 270]
MGRSAKVHKRVKQMKKPQLQPAPPPEPKPKLKSSAPASTEIQSAKKRSDLRSKVKNKGKSIAKGADGGHVLAGADYVTLMMGGRRKAAEEALKLPPDS